MQTARGTPTDLPRLTLLKGRTGRLGRKNVVASNAMLVCSKLPHDIAIDAVTHTTEIYVTQVGPCFDMLSAVVLLAHNVGHIILQFYLFLIEHSM